MDVEIRHRSIRRTLALFVLGLGAGIALAVVWGTVRGGDFASNFRTASIILGVLLLVPGGHRLVRGIHVPGSAVFGHEQPVIRQASGGELGEASGFVNTIGLGAAGALLIALGVVV
jgi:hypothetical protein